MCSAVAPDIILVDNFGPEQVAEAVRRRDARAPSIQLEASGGINLATVQSDGPNRRRSHQRRRADSFGPGAGSRAGLRIRAGPGSDWTTRTVTLVRPRFLNRNVDRVLDRTRHNELEHSAAGAASRRGRRLRAAAELGPDLERVRDRSGCAGYRSGSSIERAPLSRGGLCGPAERLCPDQIEHGLATRWIGRRIAVWNRVGSTNDLAARAGRSTSNDGLVVLAEEQTAGRGRRGRSWIAPPRSSILMSVVLFPPPHLAPAVPEAAFGCAWLTALAAVATAEVVVAWTGRDATIKWPNDVRVGGRKIAGILVERALAPSQPATSCPPEPALELERGGHRHRPERQPQWRRLPPGAARPGDVDPDRARRHAGRSLRADARPDPPSGLLVRHQPVPGRRALNDCWRARSEHMGRIVRVETPAGHLVGRLIDIDLGLGLTLDFQSEPDRESCVAGRAPT